MRYVLLKWLSLPLECVLRFRHFLYDKGYFHSESGSLPSLVVGNLNLGGTGKTPFSAWVCNVLSSHHKVALLSRGYGRKGLEYVRVTPDSHPDFVGDEPLMQCLNLPQVGVAVCANRLAGIKALREEGFQWVVLDDAFQHRRVIADLNILLTRADRPFWHDHLFPFGNLRDTVAAVKRADILVITHCLTFPSASFVRMAESHGFIYNKTLFFAGLEYLPPFDVRKRQTVDLSGREVFGICGIANDQAFKKHIAEYYKLCGYRRFGDHYRYTDEDFSDMQSNVKCIITTEKDAVKLRGLKSLRDVLIVAIPVRLKILEGEENLKMLLSQRLTHPHLSSLL